MKKSQKSEQQREARVFLDRPKINNAYSDIRAAFKSHFNQWNIENPDNEFKALDLYLMAYLHFCIPEKTKPSDLFSNTKLVQDRFKGILYPILEDSNKIITEESYLKTISERSNIKNFLNRLTASRIDNPSNIPYIIPGSVTTFKNIYDAHYIKPGTKILLRANSSDYETVVNSKGKIDIKIGGKLMEFESPTQAGIKGINYKGFNQWNSSYVIQSNGGRTLLGDYRKRFEIEKPFPAHFDSASIERNDANKTLMVQPSKDNDFYEGAIKRISVEVRERDASARMACIEYHKCKCAICEFDFGIFYGLEADGFIHVHHIEKLGDSNGQRKVDPIKDLIPLCPNCHSVVHLRKKPYTVEEVRKMIQTAKKQRQP